MEGFILKNPGIRQGPDKRVYSFHARCNFRAPQNGHGIIPTKFFNIGIIEYPST